MAVLAILMIGMRGNKYNQISLNSHKSNLSLVIKLVNMFVLTATKQV